MTPVENISITKTCSYYELWVTIVPLYRGNLSQTSFQSLSHRFPSMHRRFDSKTSIYFIWNPLIPSIYRQFYPKGSCVFDTIPRCVFIKISYVRNIRTLIVIITNLQIWDYIKQINISNFNQINRMLRFPTRTPTTLLDAYLELAFLSFLTLSFEK